MDVQIVASYSISSTVGPTPEFTYTPDIECGYTVNFDASTSIDNNGGNYNLKFEWDFEYNGTFSKDANGVNKEYEFPGCGTYTVALKVEDPDVPEPCNVAIYTQTISVEDNIAPWFTDFPIDENNNQPCASFPILRFDQPYTQEPGFGDNDGVVELGEKFRYPNVTPDMDVLVNIVAINNVALIDLDLNDSEPNAFKPSTSWNFANKDDFGYVEFLFEFVEPGTTIPYVLQEFVTNFNDIDGESNYAEQNWSQDPTTYTVNNPTELDLDFDQSGWILATGPDFSYGGGLSNNITVNLTTTHNNTSTFRFRVGGVAFDDNASSGGRLHNVTFSCLANYDNPETITTAITVSCDDIPELELLDAEDNCGGDVTVTVNEEITPGSCPSGYTIVRTWTAEDECGNTTSRSQTINVEDTELPTFKIPKDEDIECIDDLDDLSITGEPTQVEDNCGTESDLTLTYSDVITAGSCVNQAVVTRTWRLEDQCGNVTTEDQIITVLDDVEPDFDKPLNITLECSQDTNDTSITGIPTNLTDNCSTNLTVAFTDAIQQNGCTNNYTITRTWTVTDECNNVKSLDQRITVRDTTPPSFVESLPTNTTVSSNAIPTAATLTAIDNCSTAAVTFNEVITGNICSGSNTITRTWTATDLCGLTTSHTQVITVTQSPINISVDLVTNVICSSPAAGGIDITVTGGLSNYSFAWNDTNNSTTEDLTNVVAGTYTVTVTDANGCVATSSPIVVDAGPCAVDDIMPNVIEENQITYNVINNGNGTSDVDNNIVISSLNNTNLLQPANGTITINNSTGQITYIPNADFNGTDTFEYQICDATGLCDVALVTVTVTPEVDVIEDFYTTLLNTPITRDVSSNDDFEGTNNEVTSTTDPANGTVVINPSGTITYTPDSGFLGVDTFQYTNTVTNADGSTTTETTTVTIIVQDNEGPDIDTQAVNFEVQCGPNNTTQFNDWLNNNGYAVAVDNSGSVTWSNNYNSFTDGCGDTGIVTVTFTASDPSGNVSVTSATFVIVDNLPPTLEGYPSGAGNTQPSCVNVPELIFSNYTEESGDGNNNTFLQGEVFRFSNVAPNVDALLTIVETYNATVPILDDNAIGINSFRPRTAFSLAHVGDRAYAEFKFDFVAAGTNTPSSLPEFIANFNDIDGNTSYGEQNWTDINTDYTVNNPTELTITSENPWLVATAGIVEYDGVTNSNPQTNITTEYNNATTFSFRMGVVARRNNVSSSGRQHSVEFACIGNYTSATVIEEDITLECSDLTPPETLTATDQCGDADVTFSEIRTNGDCANNYTLLRQWVATDQCGNTTTRNLTINVIDTTDPTFNESLPSDVTVTYDNIPTAAILTASDDCDTNVNVVYSETENGSYCDASHTILRNWFAEDDCGNSVEHSQTITLNHPILSASINSVSDVNCFGDATGEITIDVFDGIPPYSYLWSNSSTSQNLTNAIAGTYSVTITDSNGCVTSVNATIKQPSSALSLSINKVNATSIRGCTDGSATAVVSGGTSPYTYQWSASAGNQTGVTANNLPVGNHSVVVTDANGCKTNQSVEITCTDDCDTTITTGTVTNVLCFGDATGNASVSASSVINPTATFTFTWSNGQVDAGVTSSTISNVIAGGYSVSVTMDGSVCDPVVQAITISQPSEALSLSINKVNATSIQGCTDGSATAVVSGGTSPYTYQWSASAGNQTGVTANNLPVGNHSVIVTDANGCKTNQSVEITCTDDCDTTITTGTVTNVLCFGDATGNASVSASSVINPTATFTFTWSNGQVDAGVTSSTISNVIAGGYSVSVTMDGSVCDPVVQAITISQPSEALSLSINKVNATSIQGCTDGSATAVVSGGTSPYTYQWSASAGNQTGVTASNLPVGNHSVIVTDANGCKTNQSVEITCTDDCDTTITTGTVTNVLCFGDATGNASVSASSVINPTATFTFTWSNGQVDAGVTSSTISNVIAGGYSVSVTMDGSVCDPVVQAITISQPSEALSLSINKVNATSIQGCTDGSATAVVSGGTSPYTYQWSASAGNQTGVTASNLPVGNHSVIVTDANGCKTNQSVEITCTDDCDTTITTGTVTNVLCFGDATGAASVSASSVINPTATFTFTWSNGQVDAGVTSSTISNVIAGGYSVSVTMDGSVCDPVVQAITISQPSEALSLSINKVNATSIQGCTDGSATAVVSGGTSPYTYQWSASAGNQTGVTASNLPVGNHSVIVTDANGCKTNQSVEITCTDDCDTTITTGTVTNVLCFGDATGNASVSASSVINPTATFTFTWSNGQVDAGVTSSTISNVIAGGYSVSVTMDGSVCDPVVQAITISQPSEALSLSINKVNATSIQGCTDGSATAVVSGGTSPYTYQWSASAGNQTGVTASNLPVGNHSVIVTDANGCKTNQSVEITCTDDCDTTITTGTVTNVLCFGDATGAASVSASSVINPTATFTFTWSNGQVDAGVTSSTISNVIAGGYSVSVTMDGSVCDPVVQSITITEPSGSLSASITTQTDIVCDNLGQFTVEGSGGTPPYSYSIDNGTNYVSSGTFTDLIDGNYSIIVQDSNGCTFEITTDILTNCTDAIADINNTFVGQPVSGNVLTNDEDFEGDNQTVTANTNPANGTVVINPDGSYTYTPNSGFIGEDTFTYTICDDGNPQACDTATVYIEVLPEGGPENEAPIANADTATTPEGTSINIEVLANDFDPDADSITITATTNPANGTVTLNPDGTITYTPDFGFIGEDTFTYTICDDGIPQLCDTATVTVTVQPAGYPNTTNANDDAYNTTPGADVTGNVLANDNDIQGRYTDGNYNYGDYCQWCNCKH